MEVKYIDLPTDDDRYPRVLPAEIGLVPGLFSMPTSIFERKIENPKEMAILPSCAYPSFLNQAKNKTKKKSDAYIAVEEYVETDYLADFEVESSSVDLNMLVNLSIDEAEFDEEEKAQNRFYSEYY